MPELECSRLDSCGMKKCGLQELAQVKDVGRGASMLIFIYFILKSPRGRVALQHRC